MTSRGHLGINKTLDKIRKRFYWLHIRHDVEAVSYTHLDVYKRQFPLCPVALQHFRTMADILPIRATTFLFCCQDRSLSLIHIFHIVTSSIYTSLQPLPNFYIACVVICCTTALISFQIATLNHRLFLANFEDFIFQVPSKTKITSCEVG